MCCPRRSFLEGVGLLKGGTRVVPTRWQKGGAAVVLSASCRDVVAIVFGDTVRRRNACRNEEGNRQPEAVLRCDSEIPVSVRRRPVFRCSSPQLGRRFGTSESASSR